jgi:hypothetical protein
MSSVLPVGSLANVTIPLGGTIQMVARGTPNGVKWPPGCPSQAVLTYSGGPTNPIATITAVEVSTSNDIAIYTIQAIGTLCGVVTLTVSCDMSSASRSFKIMDIASVDWEGVVPTDGGTHNFTPNGNPPAHGAGHRIFAERNVPDANAPLHNLVRLKATMTQNVADGQSLTVFWKIFDVDDSTQNFITGGNPADALAGC